MIEDLKFPIDLVEWMFNSKHICIPLENVIMASLDSFNDYVLMETGEKFATTKTYIYRLSGNLLLVSDKQNGFIKWSHNSKQYSLEIPNIVTIGCFLEKKVITVMYRENEKESIVFDLNGNVLCEVEKIANYEMLYFQEFPDYISVVMEGDAEIEDSYKRRSKNFKIRYSSRLVRRNRFIVLIKDGLSK